MKKIKFLLIGLILMSCGAKNSNTAKGNNGNETGITKVDSAYIDPGCIDDPMSDEEAELAVKVGAVSAKKLEDGNFLVGKMIAPEVYARLISLDRYIIIQDSMEMYGVVSATGKWLVNPEYDDVFPIGKDAYVGSLTVDLRQDDYTQSFYETTPLYQVVYRGKRVGSWGLTHKIKPIVYKGKIKGFLKISGEDDKPLYYYIDINGKGWNERIRKLAASYPSFEKYQIKGNILTLWGGGKSPDDLLAFPAEDRSVYQVDLATGRVLNNPFVSVLY